MQSTINPENEADLTYTWPWGEVGACTHAERPLVEQQAVNLDRGGQVQFVPISKGPQPITRDERIQLRATLLTVEEDLVAARAEIGRLTASNGQLARETATLQTRLASYEHALRETKESLDIVVLERDEARTELATAAQELANLKAFVPRADV